MFHVARDCVKTDMFITDTKWILVVYCTGKRISGFVKDGYLMHFEDLDKVIMPKIVIRVNKKNFKLGILRTSSV